MHAQEVSKKLTVAGRGKTTVLVMHETQQADLGWRLYPQTFFEQYQYGSLAPVHKPR